MSISIKELLLKEIEEFSEPLLEQVLDKGGSISNEVQTYYGRS